MSKLSNDDLQRYLEAVSGLGLAARALPLADVFVGLSTRRLEARAAGEGAGELRVMDLGMATVDALQRFLDAFAEFAELSAGPAVPPELVPPASMPDDWAVR